MEGGPSFGIGAKSQLTTSGGFRQTFGGSISEEHLDKAAAADSGHNEQLAQQSSVLGQRRAVQEAAAIQGANKTALAQTPEKIATQPRAIAGLGQELLKRPVKDFKDSFQAMFDINTLLRGTGRGQTYLRSQFSKKAPRRSRQRKSQTRIRSTRGPRISCSQG